MGKLPDDLLDLARQISTAIDVHIPNRMAVASEKHINQNFEKEGYGGMPWKDVKRRDPSSRWYGYQYKAGGRSFSPTATKRKVLRGPVNRLRKSIDVSVKPSSGGMGIFIRTDSGYASVHNEGLKASIFGKKSFVMTKRQFMPIPGQPLDRGLDDDINRIIEMEMKRAFKG